MAPLRLGDWRSEFDFRRFAAGDVMILHSDGVRDITNRSELGNIQRGSMQQLAETILRDRGQATDDAAVLTFRWESALLT